MQAMILAAGFGTRLLPFTQFRPKPLFPIVNVPLLVLTVKRLKQAGFDRIVVNCHHLRQQIIDVLRPMEGIIIQEEDTILGTGGGLRLALRSFRDEPVLVTNGDIYHTVDFRSLYEAHDNEKAPITMAMHDFPRFNRVLTENNFVKSFEGDNIQGSIAYTGLQVVSPEILEPISLKQESSIVNFYKILLKKKIPIRSLRVDGCFWTDMGTTEDYLALHSGLLTRKIPWLPELGPQPKTPFLLGDEKQPTETVTMKDWVCAGRVELGRDVRLERVILWDGVRVPDGSRLRDMLIGK